MAGARASALLLCHLQCVIVGSLSYTSSHTAPARRTIPLGVQEMSGNGVICLLSIAHGKADAGMHLSG